MITAHELDKKITQAVEDNDANALRNLLEELYKESDETSRPYDAAIELKEEYVEALGPGSYEGDVAVRWANRIARAERLVKYKLKTAFGFDGIRIVEEGDSWFQYPLLLEDIIDNFVSEPDLAIYSLAAAGDLVEHMALRREYAPALRDTNSRILLLSGGGNDLLGEGRLELLLKEYRDNTPVEELVDKGALIQASDRILSFYEQILHDVKINFPGVKIFGHGYDTPFPKQGGKYFGKPFKNKKIPLDVGRKVVELISSYFSDRLSSIQNTYDNFVFVNLKGSVGDSPNSWDDELHPENAGFKRAAKKMLEVVREHVEQAPSGAFESTQAAYFDGLEHHTQKTVVLDPGHGGTTSNGGSSWNNAIGPSGSLEKKWTLDVCKRARDLLVQQGYKVHLTRESDINPSLAERRRTARDVAADCFVSVHFNASRHHNAQGTETFVHKTTASPMSIQLMRAVQGSMVSALGHRDRNFHNGRNGVLRGAYGVINESRHHRSTAVCLHEVSFMDRADEERRIKQESYRERIAQALSSGIISYFGAGQEAASLEMLQAEEGFEDSIHANAAALDLSVVQYLGLAEDPATPPRPAFEQGLDDRSHRRQHFDGSMLTAQREQQLACNDALIEAMLREATPSQRLEADHIEADDNEDRFIKPSDGSQFDHFGQDPGRDRLQLESTFGGLEFAAFDYAEFSAFVSSLGLRFFSARELLYPGGSNESGPCAGRNGPPPQQLWRNIASTARMLDEIRARLGAPIRILSGYRNPAYNSCVGGKPGSLHLTFNALDWTCVEGSVDDWHQVAVTVRREHPEYAGGIGLYRSSKFIHVDTRGNDADWIQS